MTVMPFLCVIVSRSHRLGGDAVVVLEVVYRLWTHYLGSRPRQKQIACVSFAHKVTVNHSHYLAFYVQPNSRTPSWFSVQQALANIWKIEGKTKSGNVFHGRNWAQPSKQRPLRIKLWIWGILNTQLVIFERLERKKQNPTANFSFQTKFLSMQCLIMRWKITVSMFQVLISLYAKLFLNAS